MQWNITNQLFFNVLTLKVCYNNSSKRRLAKLSNVSTSLMMLNEAVEALAVDSISPEVVGLGALAVESSSQVGLLPVQPSSSHLLSSFPTRLKPSIQEKVATEPNVVVMKFTRPFSGLESP